jgi:hypothetical protein
MKKYLLLLSFLALPLAAHADVYDSDAVAPTMIRTSTMNVINVSSNSMTQMDTYITSTTIQGLTFAPPTGTLLVGRKFMKIQNIDSKANLWCQFYSVSPSTSAINNAYEIGPSTISTVSNISNIWEINMADNALTSTAGAQINVGTRMTVYCTEDNSNVATTKAILIQGY